MSTSRSQSADGNKATQKTRSATTPVLLLRDFWDASGTRHPKGATIDTSVAVAKELISARKAERADPFPGEAPS